MLKKSQNDLLDVLSASLEDPSKPLPEKESRYLLRLKDAYTWWLQHPLYNDARIRDYLMASYQIGRSQAYSDIAIIKALFGSVGKADKEFQRFRANKILEMATAAALAGNTEKAKSLQKIADSIVKVNRLDEPESENLPWDEIVPKDYSLTVNPEVIGIKPEPGAEQKAKALLAQYLKDIDPDGAEVSE